MFSAIVMFLVVCAGFVGVLYVIVRIVVRSSQPPLAQDEVPATQVIANPTLPASVGTRSFHASSESQMGKMRRSLWIAMAATLVISAVIHRGDLTSTVWTTAIFFIFLLSMDMLLRKRMAQIEAEVLKLGERMKNHIEQLNKKK